MKRMQLIAAALCLVMITTIGAGVVAAKQTENPSQAGASQIYFYEVAATSTHGTGKLMIDTAKHTFVFNGKKFTPDAMIELKARAEDGSDKVFATGKATPSGNLHIAGTWDKDVVPAAVTAGYTQVSAMGLFQEGWFVAKLSFYYSTDNGATWTETVQSGGINRPDEVWWSLDQFGVPYGALVKIHVTVVAGKDKTASEVYQYTTSIERRAMYEITGTTLNNKLEFDGYF